MQTRRSKKLTELSKSSADEEEEEKLNLSSKSTKRRSKRVLLSEEDNDEETIEPARTFKRIKRKERTPTPSASSSDSGSSESSDLYFHSASNQHSERNKISKYSKIHSAYNQEKDPINYDFYDDYDFIAGDDEIEYMTDEDGEVEYEEEEEEEIVEERPKKKSKKSKKKNLLPELNTPERRSSRVEKVIESREKNFEKIKDHLWRSKGDQLSTPLSKPSVIYKDTVLSTPGSKGTPRVKLLKNAPDSDEFHDNGDEVDEEEDEMDDFIVEDDPDDEEANLSLRKLMKQDTALNKTRADKYFNCICNNVGQFPVDEQEIATYDDIQVSVFVGSIVTCSNPLCRRMFHSSCVGCPSRNFVCFSCKDTEEPNEPIKSRLEKIFARLMISISDPVSEPNIPLLEEYPDVVRYSSPVYNLRTLLHIAISYQREDYIHALLEHGADLEVTDGFGRNALFECIRTSWREGCALIFQSLGEDLGQYKHKRKTDLKPNRFMDILLRKRDYQNISGYELVVFQSLHLLTSKSIQSSSCFSTLVTLLSPTPFELYRCEEGMFPGASLFQIAARYGIVEILHSMFQRPELDLFLRDSQGRNILHYVCSCTRPNMLTTFETIMNALKNIGPMAIKELFSNEGVDNGGRNAFFYLSGYEFFSDPSQEDIEWSLMNFSSLADDYVSLEGDDDEEEEEEQGAPTRLTQRRSKVIAIESSDESDSEQQPEPNSPTIYPSEPAAIDDHIEIDPYQMDHDQRVRLFADFKMAAEKLYSQGMSVFNQGADGLSCLHIAALNGIAPLVKFFLDRKIPSNVADSKGWTPLLYCHIRECVTNDDDANDEQATKSNIDDECLVLLLENFPSQLYGLAGHLDDETVGPVVRSLIYSLATKPGCYNTLNKFIRSNLQVLENSLSWMVKIPGLMDFETKKLYFHRLLSKGNSRGHLYGLTLTVHRQNIFESTYQNVRNISGRIPYSRLERVYFANEVAGGQGVTREFWDEVGKDLAKESTKVFAPTNGSQQKLFIAPETYQEYSRNVPDEAMRAKIDKARFAGELVALAMTSKQLIPDLNFAAPIWNRLAVIDDDRNSAFNDRDAITMDDWEFIDRELWRGWKWISENKLTGEEGFSFTLDVVDRIVSNNPVIKTIPLIRNGENVDVVDANKKDYLARVLAEKNKTYARLLRAFLNGYRTIIPSKTVNFFNAKELELLVVGINELDVADWKRNTNWMSPTPGYIKEWFWKMVGEMSNEERILLLKFTTGCSRLGSGGFKTLMGMDGSSGFNIYYLSNVVDRLPSASTCFNMLKFCKCSSYQMMKEKFFISIRHGNTGFSFS